MSRFCFGLVLLFDSTPSKLKMVAQTEQRKPLAASAIEQYQKPNEDVKLHPEKRTMESQIVLLKDFTHAHTHCTDSWS